MNARRIIEYLIASAVVAWVLTAPAVAQVSNASVGYVAAAPTGSCTAAPPIQVVTSTGVLYTCNNGTWAAQVGSGTFTALTGDATSTATGGATTVKGINNTLLSGLATGLLKNTTTTGVPSIAIPGTDYAAPLTNQTDEGVAFSPTCSNSYYVTASVTATLPNACAAGGIIAFDVKSGFTLTLTAGTITYNGPASVQGPAQFSIKYDGAALNAAWGNAASLAGVALGTLTNSDYCTYSSTGPTISCNSTGGGGTAWSGLTAPSANLTLSMGSYTSEFDTTSALASFFKYANTTAATSSVNQSSPVVNLCGYGWEGSTPVSTQDCGTLQYSIPNGSNPAPQLLLGETGSSTNGNPLSLVMPGSSIIRSSSGGLNIGVPSGSSITLYGNINAQTLLTVHTDGTYGYSQFGDPFNFSGQKNNSVVQVPGQVDEFTTSLKATAALTAGQVVKIDTANANSVVVATTTDTAAGATLGFVENSPGAAGQAYIAMPGSVITDPKLGTGACTIGQFVIVDTTTNGDVKCTSTYTDGTILGKALTAQSTVGSAVSVYVQPM